ncbi:MAG: nuclear transport factor 2 family protein [Bacteroidetes bacterium]|nr:nuclear transport factor 2 family protein [Bacteroidota bacterium]
MKVVFTIVMTLILIAGLGSYSLKAQEWSPVQKEVWKNVNDYWALMAKGDINGFLGYMHNDYLGWDNEDPLPATKEDSQKWLQFSFQFTKILNYSIKPLGIKVYGDVAFVHYYYYIVRESDGKKNWEQGRWTDILLKQVDKWVMIGDHGGSVKVE